MSRTQKTTLGITALLVVCSLFFWRANLNGQQVETPYPAMWTDLDLPRVPQAEILDFKKIYNEGEGVSLDFDCNMPVEDVAMKIEDDFFKQGFTTWTPDEETPTKYKSSYSSKNTEVSVNIETNPIDPSRSNVNIQVVRPLSSKNLPGGNVGTGGQSATRVD